ncbi:MAG TPA: DUF1801 domain-containing protein [Actinomycetota bacterium]|nr:DUF1801 domain-containing protein [Actinomycetota bacterium]
MSANPIDDYLATIPDDMRAALSKVRATVAKAAPGATEAISYGMPAFKYGGRGLVAFAAFKNHCSFFPMSGRVLDQLGDDLQRFRTSKGTLQFTPAEPLPPALIRAIVRARIAEIDARPRR